jgi:hypothetical protein
MPSFFALHNIIPFFAFTLTLAFLLNFQSDSAFSIPDFERNLLFARFVLVGIVVALLLRWRVYLAMPIPILGSHPHPSAYRMLVKNEELGRGTGGHKCGPPERKHPVAYRLFDERKSADGSVLLPPVAVYFPCRFASEGEEDEQDILPHDDESFEKMQSINAKLSKCSMPWLPRQDFRSVAGINVRQNTPEFSLYHWTDVKIRAKDVSDTNANKSNEKIKPIFNVQDILCTDECPLILFSHGNCTNCNFYSQFCIELASRGAVVVVPWYMDGSSSGCLLRDANFKNDLAKFESFPLRTTTITTGATGEKEGESSSKSLLHIHYKDTPIGPQTESNSVIVEVREEQLNERVRETENVANKLLANGMLFGREMLGWFDNELKLRKCINRIRSSENGGGVNLLGHSFGAATVFAVLAERLENSNTINNNKFSCHFKNYTCYDLWSLPSRKHVDKVEKFFSSFDSSPSEIPFLELQTSDEWSFLKTTHVPLINRILNAYPEERCRYRVKKGTDHLSLSDGGLLSPKYFRHRDSKRRGLWTDDSIFICDYAIEAFETMKKR